MQHGLSRVKDHGGNHMLRLPRAATQTGVVAGRTGAETRAQLTQSERPTISRRYAVRLIVHLREGIE